MLTDSLENELKRLVRVGMGAVPQHAGSTRRILDRVIRKLGVQLPEPLLVFYGTVGAVPTVMDAYQHFIPPRALGRENGGLRFCDENQGVVFWGVLDQNLRAKDPPVHQGNPDESTWYEDCRSLSSFLVNMTCWQLLSSMPSAAVCSPTPEALRALEGRLQPVTPVEDYEVQSFIDEPHGILACRVGSMDELHIAARTAKDLDLLAQDTGVKLSYRRIEAAVRG